MAKRILYKFKNKITSEKLITKKCREVCCLRIITANAYLESYIHMNSMHIYSYRNPHNVFEIYEQIYIKGNLYISG